MPEILNVNDREFEIDFIGKLRNYCQRNLINGALSPNGEIQFSSTWEKIPSTGIPFTIRYWIDEGEDAFEVKFDLISNQPKEVQDMINKLSSAAGKYWRLQAQAERKIFRNRLWAYDGNFQAQTQAIEAKFTQLAPYNGDEYILNIATSIQKIMQDAFSNALLNPIVDLVTSYLLVPIEDWLKHQGQNINKQKRLALKIAEGEHQSSLYEMYPSTP